MADRMHPDRQLGEDEGQNEEEVTEGIHEWQEAERPGARPRSAGSINLNQQAFEVFTLGKVQGDRVIGGA